MRVGAVDDILEVPLDGGAVEEETVLVVGHERADGDDGGLLDVLADEGGIGVDRPLHLLFYYAHW